MTHLFAEFRHRLASGSRTPALLCFLGLSCLGLEAVGFVFHREGEILPLVLVILYEQQTKIRIITHSDVLCRFFRFCKTQ
jgi:hypothetical protein